MLANDTQLSFSFAYNLHPIQIIATESGIHYMAHNINNFLNYILPKLREQSTKSIDFYLHSFIYYKVHLYEIVTTAEEEHLNSHFENIFYILPMTK